MTKEQQQSEIDLMSTMQCDTPMYDDFVADFLQKLAHKDQQPTVRISRKFCSSWPISQRPDQSQRTETNSETEKEAETNTETEIDTVTDSSDGAMQRPAKEIMEIRVGVMDSSFNPPHYCHGAYLECLAIMELAPTTATGHEEARVLDIDAYLMLLSSTNVDKRLSGASLEQRMRMVDMLATTVAQDTSADTWHLWKSREQFDRSNLHNMAIGMVNSPRFVDKCVAVADVVRREWLRSAGLDTDADSGIDAPRVLSYFAMGWDTLIRFFDRKYYAHYHSEIRSFFDNGGRIAYSRRSGFPDADVEAFFAREDIAEYLQYIFELTLPKRVKHISSTEVRLAVRDSTQSVRDIPPRILEFVNNSQLYRDPSKEPTAQLRL
ncbi:hypothetical protein J3B02_000227 [Coemansia erecta]|nr:hypothetical protein J3B02_000227 [Coemansia erecta]